MITTHVRLGGVAPTTEAALHNNVLIHLSVPEPSAYRMQGLGFCNITVDHVSITKFLLNFYVKLEEEWRKD